jgi:hypothetical protein
VFYYFLNRVLVYIHLPKASKYLYISLDISIFLPRASNSLYISVTIELQYGGITLCGDNTAVGGGITLFVEV